MIHLRSAAAAALTAHGAAAFDDEDGDGGEGGGGIGPGDVECGIEGESGEGDEGEIGAGGGLDGVGGESIVAGRRASLRFCHASRGMTSRAAMVMAIPSGLAWG